MSAALRMVMAKHKITSKALRIETKMTAQSISAILNEHKKPRINSCHKIVDAIESLCGRSYHVDTLFPHLKEHKYVKQLKR